MRICRWRASTGKPAAPSGPHLLGHQAHGRCLHEVHQPVSVQVSLMQGLPHAPGIMSMQRVARHMVCTSAARHRAGMHRRLAWRPALGAVRRHSAPGCAPGRQPECVPGAGARRTPEPSPAARILSTAEHLSSPLSGQDGALLKVSQEQCSDRLAGQRSMSKVQADWEDQMVSTALARKDAHSGSRRITLCWTRWARRSSMRRL